MNTKHLLSDTLHQDLTLDAAADYLFEELSRGKKFVISSAARDFFDHFKKVLKKKKSLDRFRQSLDGLKDQPAHQFRLVLDWLEAYLLELQQPDLAYLLPEVALLILNEEKEDFQELEVTPRIGLSGFQGEHPRLDQEEYLLSYPDFIHRLKIYRQEVVTKFRRFQQLKRDHIDQYRKELRLATFKPKVMSSFVRNKLIDRVYLPLIGDNLAKQIGTSGADTRTDRMGLLLLLSPPGYGKTTLMEYIANRLGLIFMKIDGPTLGHRVYTLDPGDAPNRAAAQELEKLNLAFEMGDNVMIYVDDIQHCHPEFLQKFISLCDGQRKIEGVWKGKAKSYAFRTKRLAVVMAGNPYTESGERFQVPDMLANRADIYNLGDLIGGQEEAFKLSYIENALTSNPSLNRLAAKSMADVYTLMQEVGKEKMGHLDLEANHSSSELNEYTAVLKKLLRIQEVILLVNRAYIQSAAIADADRTAPPFRLQGSYRNMNKLAEKVVPIMNEQELENIILDHYEGEIQTLTSGAEANRLKLRELMGILTPEEQKRWKAIQKNFLEKHKQEIR